MSYDKAGRDLPPVCVVLLNWNCWPETVQAARSLHETTYPGCRIIIVDNGSTDGSEQQIRERLSNVELIQTGENLGYGGGNNIGIRHAMKSDARYVLIVNPDITVRLDTLSQLVAAAERDPEMAALSPVIYSAQDQDSIWFSGGIINWQDARTLHQQEPLPPDTLRPSDWAAGSCLLLRLEPIKQEGVFDQSYFLYFEEVDLCERLRAAGHKVGVYSDATAVHRPTTTVRLGSPKFVYYFTRSSLQFFARHASGHGMSRLSILWKLYRRYLLNLDAWGKLLRRDASSLARARACFNFLLGRLGRCDAYE